ncbi:MAG: sigma-70 family RNA polymerase sigma factor [Clostridia bacterium]|nr:sigma-70 family RNA polymerase sigma factor [Clostridia bacterium]
MGMIQAPNQTPADRLDRMVQLYEKDLLRICCVYLRDRIAAEDVVQETFLKAFKSMDSFRGDSSEKTWLTTIAINCCRDYRRSAWYRYIDRRISLDQLSFMASASPSDEHIALTMAIMKLKPKYMEVVLLYFYEGYRIKEIAKMLNLTEAAVSSRIHKAKQKLRTELEGGEGDEK